MTASAERQREARIPTAFVTRSDSFRSVLDQVHRLAQFGAAPILLEGDTGTGKTLLARYIHNISPRHGKAFHSVVLSTLDDSLASSDLFGHVVGAFTDARRARTGYFVASHGSTLLLDEIGKASRTLQGKLLHAIEYNEVTPVGSDTATRVDVRIIAATNIPLTTLVSQEQFLPDLAARFGFFCIRLPPLSERKADIPELISQCVDRHANAFGYSTAPVVSAELVALLESSPWPTNLRGLDSAIQYLLANANRSGELRPEHCSGPLEHIVRDLHVQHSQTTLEQTVKAVAEHGSVSAAARALCVPRSTVQRRLQKAEQSIVDGPD